MSTLRSFIKQVLNEGGYSPDQMAALHAAQSSMSDAKNVALNPEEKLAIDSMNDMLINGKDQLIRDVDNILKSGSSEPGGGSFITTDESLDTVTCIIEALKKDLEYTNKAAGGGLYIYPYRTALTIITLERGEVYAGEAWGEVMTLFNAAYDYVSSTGDKGVDDSSGSTTASEPVQERRLSLRRALLQEALGEFLASAAAHIAGSEVASGVKRVIGIEAWQRAILATIREKFIRDPAAFRAFFNEVVNGGLQRDSTTNTLKNLSQEARVAFESFSKGFNYTRLSGLLSNLEQTIKTLSKKDGNIAVRNDAAYELIRGFMMRITDPSVSLFPASLDAAKADIRKFAQSSNDPNIELITEMAFEKGMQNPTYKQTEIDAANRFFDEVAELTYDFTKTLKGQLPIPRGFRKSVILTGKGTLLAGAVAMILWGAEYTGVLAPYKELDEDEVKSYIHHEALRKIALAALDKMMSNEPYGYSVLSLRKAADLSLKTLFEKDTIVNLEASKIQPVIDAYELARENMTGAYK